MLAVVGGFAVLFPKDGDGANSSPNVATENASRTPEDFAREFCDVFHRFNERVLKKADQNSEFVKALKAASGSTARSAIEKRQERESVSFDEIPNIKDDPVHPELPAFSILNNLLEDVVRGDVSTRVIVRDELRVVLDELRALDAPNAYTSSLSPALQKSFQNCLETVKNFVDIDPTNEAIWTAFIHLFISASFEEFYKNFSRRRRPPSPPTPTRVPLPFNRKSPNAARLL